MTDIEKIMRSVLAKRGYKPKDVVKVIQHESLEEDKGDYYMYTPQHVEIVCKIAPWTEETESVYVYDRNDVPYNRDWKQQRLGRATYYTCDKEVV